MFRQAKCKKVVDTVFSDVEMAAMIEMIYYLMICSQHAYNHCHTSSSYRACSHI